MLSQETIQKILGIEEVVYTTPETMADKLNITFFPYVYTSSANIINFSKKLKEVFLDLKVNIVPYEQATEKVPYYKIIRRVVKFTLNDVLFVIEKVLMLQAKHEYIDFQSVKSFLKRNRLKKGISVVSLGEQKVGNLPMEFIRNFKDNSVISILDFPLNIKEDSNFHDHFDTSMNLFSYHMTNIVIAVDEKRWMLYNFNASHPIYLIEKDFKKNVLHALIPKIVAPISPHRFSDFTLMEGGFNPNDEDHKNSVEDLVDGALLFGGANLYPAGKKIDDLSFRNSFYRSIGKMHLDNRNGMSFGFLAHQMPTKLSEVIKIDEFERRYNTKVSSATDCFSHDGFFYISFVLNSEHYCMKVPDVFVLTQRSGSDKINVVPDRDLVKLGLSKGVMFIQPPQGLILNSNYRPSFDTKVILAHALGNAIIASILKHHKLQNDFSKIVELFGLGIAHWHGYLNPLEIPHGLQIHGFNNPHVACSSPQSAIYAIDGKLQAFKKVFEIGAEYKGDVHIEPHHGSNVNYSSIVDLAKYILKSPTVSVLGNHYLYRYNRETLV